MGSTADSSNSSSAAGRRRWRWLKWIIAATGIVLLLPVLLLGWALFTESGLHALTGMLPRLTDGQVRVEGASGRLAGRLHIDSILVEQPNLRVYVRDALLEWRPSALWSRHVDIAALAAASVDVSSRPDDAAPDSELTPPPEITLPVGISVHTMALGRFGVYDWVDDAAQNAAAGETVFEARDLRAAFFSDGRRHRIENLAVDSPYGALALNAALDLGASPFALSADGSFSGAYAERQFEVRFAADGDLLSPHVTAQISEGEGGMHGSVEALASPFEFMPLRQALIALDGVDPAALHPAAPHALLSAHVELSSRKDDERALSGSLNIANQDPRTVDDNGVPVSRLAAQLALTMTPQASPSSPQPSSPSLQSSLPYLHARIDDLLVELSGDGRLGGNIDWRHDGEGSGPFGRLMAQLTLSGVRTDLLDARLPTTHIAGEINADGDAAAQRADVDVQINEARIQANGEMSLPAAGGAAAFSAQGEISRFNPAELIPASPAADINVHFETKGELAEQPQIAFSWRFAPSTFNRLPLAGHGEVTLRGAALSHADIELDIVGNTVTAKGGWGSGETSLDIAADLPALAGLGVGMEGWARITAQLSGTPEMPSGHVLARAENLRVPGDVRLDSMDVQGRLDAGLNGPVQLHLAANGVGAAGSEAWLENLALVVDGKQDKHEITLTATTPQADALNLRLEGGLSRQQGKDGQGGQTGWQGRLMAFESEGRLALRQSAAAALTILPERIELGETRFAAGEQGHIVLSQTRWTPQEIAAKGSLSGLVVDLRPKRSTRPRRGPAPLQLGAEWDVRLAGRANGKLHIFREDGDIFVPGETPLRIALDQLDGRVTIDNNRADAALEVRGKDIGTLHAALSALLEKTGGGWRAAPNGALSGEAKLAMPSINWLATAFQENIDLSGGLRANVSISGTTAKPQMNGSIEGDELGVALLDEGMRLAGGHLRVDFDHERLKLTRLVFESPNRVDPDDERIPLKTLTQEPGRLSVGGEMALDSGEGRFTFDIERLPLLQRADRWLMLSGKGEADTSWTKLGLKAEFNVDAGFIELGDTPPPSLSDDVVIVGKDDKPAKAGMAMDVNVSVSLGEHLYLSALGLDTRLAGALRVDMGEGGLAAVGTVRTVGGVFQGYGQNLTLERGLINFQGPIDNPGLNIVALRKGLAVEAGIEVSGSARRPQIKLVSQPDVPDPDKLSWIVLGRAPDAGSGGDMGLLLPAAQALLGTGNMTKQLSRSLGLDQFGIGQGELGSVSRTATSSVVGDGSTVSGDAAADGQVLMLGKRLSSDLFLSFEQSLGGAATLVKLTYQLTRRVSAVARGGTDNSGDIYYTVSFR